MPDEKRLTDEEVRRYVEASSETDAVDHKAAMSWDGKRMSASLTKDILAFANSPDGGAIVIGKSESESGEFVLDGLTEEQGATFETTRVAQWVNARCGPPVDLVCYRTRIDDKLVVAIVVSEFRDIPIVCTKPYSDGKKHVLKVGVYVRTADAASAPISREDEARRLIGLAVRKQGDALASTLSAILSGRKTELDEDVVEAVRRHADSFAETVAASITDRAERGAWTLRITPLDTVRERWSDSAEMAVVVERISVRLRSYLPWAHLGRPNEWGLCGVDESQAWGLAREGAFVCVVPFRENDADYASPWVPVFGSSKERETHAAGTWMEVFDALFTVSDLMMVAERLSAEFAPEEELNVTISAGPLRDRVLACSYANISWETTEPTGAGVVVILDVTDSAASIRANWQARCVSAVRRFLDMFPGGLLSGERIAEWIERYKNRDLGRLH